jgi:hypothetical protein
MVVVCVAVFVLSQTLKNTRAATLLCSALSRPLSTDVVVAVAVVAIAAVVISIAGFYILTNLSNIGIPTFPAFPNMPAPEVSVARNWAGYIAASDLTNPQPVVNGVSGSWTVPSVTDVGIDAFSAVWVGVGGQFDHTLIQVGTEQDFVNGSPDYSAWYEMLPADSITIDSIQVSPGDQINASVILVDANDGVWTVSLADLTTGQSFQQNFTYDSSQLSAEWIIERPEVNGALAELANFNNMTFTNCQANINGVTGAITDFAYTQVVMDAQPMGNQQIQLVSVTGTSNGGKQFTVNFVA